MVLLTCLLFGALAGLIIGILGGGSGLALVPGILIIMHLTPDIPADQTMRYAVGTTFAISLIFISWAVYIQHRLRAIDWHLFRDLFLGATVGTVLGNVFANVLPGRTLQIIFAFVVFFIGFRMLLLDNARLIAKPWPNKKQVFLAGNALGLVTGSLGISPFMVPYLRRYGVPMHRAIATSTAAALQGALVGCITTVVVGLFNATHLPHTLGYIYLPIVLPMSAACLVFSYVGVKLSHKLSPATLKKAYCALLFIVGLKMLF